MTDKKDEHRVVHLEHRAGRLEEHDKDKEERIRILEKFMAETNATLPTILEAIKELKDNNKWMRQTLAVSLIGGIVTVVGSALKWFIEH